MATLSVGSRCKSKCVSLTPLAVKMASRSQEIRPVGAWVEPGAQHDCSAVVSDGFELLGARSVGRRSYTIVRVVTFPEK